MFGCHALYRGEKIILIVRQKPEHTEDNGVWVATSQEHHQSLKQVIPSLRTIHLFGTGESAWQNIPEDSDSFESDVFTACELIKKNDVRIGRVPKGKKKKKIK